MNKKKPSRHWILVPLLLLYPAVVMVSMLFAGDEMSYVNGKYTAGGESTQVPTGPGGSVKSSCSGYDMNGCTGNNADPEEDLNRE